jgi:antitoxin PrlF
MTDQQVRRSTLREKGQLTLPLEVRQALRVEAGDEIEFQVVEGGQILIRGLKMIPADQAWFWADSWQKGEQEASRDIRAGRVETFKDDESFLAFIKAPQGDDH